MSSWHRVIACVLLLSRFMANVQRDRKKKIFYRRNVILSRVPGKRFVTRRFFSSSPQIQRVSKQVKKPSASQQVNLYQTSQSSRARINQLRNFSTDALKAVSNTETYDMQCKMIYDNFVAAAIFFLRIMYIRIHDCGWENLKKYPKNITKAEIK